MTGNPEPWRPRKPKWSCPHCHSSAGLRTDCALCNRVMCCECVSLCEQGSLCGLCADRHAARERYDRLLERHGRLPEFDEWYDRHG